MGNSIRICTLPRENGEEANGMKCQRAEDEEVSYCNVKHSCIPSRHEEKRNHGSFAGAVLDTANEPRERTGTVRGPRRISGESSSSKGGTRVKIVVRKVDLHRFLWQLNSEEGRRRSLGDVLREMEGGRRMREWTPSLGSISEGSESGDTT